MSGDFILLGLLLVASGFFSGSETAFFSLDRLGLSRLRERGRSGALAARLGEDLHRLLLVILFGNMILNVSFFSILFAIGLRTGGRGEGAVLAGAIGLPALILFGEVLPKLLAARAPAGAARLCALPLFLFSQLVQPVTRLLARLPMAQAIGRADQTVTTDELKMLVEKTAEAGEIDRAELNLVREIVTFGEIRVKEVMVPRVDMVSIGLPGSRAEALRLIAESGTTKIAAWEENRDNIVGCIDGKDLLLTDETDLRRLMRPVPIVPETKRVEALLREFQTEGTRFAVVVDEYGGTEGIVTLEHLLEEIVGEIEPEEGPPEAPEIVEHEPGLYHAHGDLTLRDMEEWFGVRVADPPLGTLGGLLALRLGRVPEAGDSVRCEHLLLTVEAVNNRRVTAVRIEGAPPGLGAEEATDG